MGNQYQGQVRASINLAPRTSLQKAVLTTQAPSGPQEGLCSHTKARDMAATGAQ